MANAKDLFNKMGSTSVPRVASPKQVIGPVGPAVGDQPGHKGFDPAKKGGQGGGRGKAGGGPGGGGSVPTSVRPKV